MKKKKILIIMTIVIILIAIVSITLITIKNKKEEQQKIEERQQQIALIEYTKERYEFFLDQKTNDSNNDPDILLLNNILKEQNNNKNINFDTFITNNLQNKTLNKTNLSNIINTIDTEINLYNLENFDKFTEDNLLSITKDTKIDHDTLINIFNQNGFIKNIEIEKEKREEYLTNLTTLKNDLTYFNDNNSLYTISNNKHVCKNNDILNKFKELNNNYNLSLKAEKEVIINTVPIILYHGVLDNPWGASSLFVKVSSFEEQMKYLSEQGYTTLHVSEIASAKNYKKPIIITFDDGYIDVYENAFPILKKYNLKANVYMISDWINGELYMTSQMTKEMSDHPLIEIGSHTANHKSLATLSDEEIEYELKHSKEVLEDMIGKNVDCIAYPKGSFDNRVTNIAKNYYTYGLSTISGKENVNKLNTYTLKRIYIYRSHTLNQFKNLV